MGDGDEDLPGQSTPTSSGALDHLASIATEELRRRSKRRRSIIDRPLGEAPVPVVERVLNHWLTGLFRTASGETASAHTLALSPTPHTQHHARPRSRTPPLDSVSDGGVPVRARRLRLHRALHRGGGHAGLLAEVCAHSHAEARHPTSRCGRC